MRTPAANLRRCGHAILFELALFVLSAVLDGCSGATTANRSVSNIRPRAFVSNSYAGTLQIINAATDTLYSGGSISVGPQPGLMALAPNKSFTLVFDAGNNNISVVNNDTETQTTTIALPSWTESIAISPDSTLGYVAMPSAIVLGHPAGILDVLDLVNNDIKFTLNIPEVHRVVLNHSGNRVLAFSDNSDAVTVINPNLIGRGAYSTSVSGFDQPVWGVFSDDDSIAYILNCGSECGGTNAGITALHMDDNSIGPTVGLSGASIAMLVSANLYVAGSGHGVGTIQVVNTAGLIASRPVTIGNGYHDRMELGSDNKLFIGARDCTSGGCLSIFDIGAQTAVVDTPSGDVTGIAPLANSNEVYVIEGGELRIFDATSSAPSTSHFIDIVGQAIDVKEVDDSP
jgi:DNA-binding beta-propeller fold protein YncE